MLELELYLLTDRAAEIARAREYLRTSQTGNRPIEIGTGYAFGVNRAFTDLTRITSALPFPVASDALRRGHELWKKVCSQENVETKGTDVSMLISAMKDFDEAFFRECSAQRAFIIDQTVVELFEQNEPVFGNRVATKFAMISTDLSEAAKCLALDRHTACVFHLMRVMEFAIQKLGKKLQIAIDVEKETWYQIGQHIGKAISGMPGQTAKEQKKKQQYGAALAGFDGVRLAWRNDVMHPKATYTGEEAKRIFSHVEGFLNALLPLV